MRWDELKNGEQSPPQLPGADVERVRSFDAPEALGINFHEVRAKSALNRVDSRSKVPFGWSVNPYRGCSHACNFCFARSSHRYLDLDAGRDFEREIVVKVNAPELLRAELSKPSWGRELVAFGTNTDPYQWAEGRYRLMPPMLEALREFRTPVSVLSKSPLPLRDIDLYLALAEVAEVSVNFSIPTLDERAWRQTEPHTPSPRKRLEAVARFNEAGIPSGVLVAPLMPGINDDPAEVKEIVKLAKEAGASFINGVTLHLRPGVKEVFMGWLASARPDLVERYEGIYGSGAYAPAGERRRVERGLRRHGQSGYRRAGSFGVNRAAPPPKGARRPVDTQPRLF